MPIIIATIIRSVIIWCVQLGLTTLAFSIMEKILDALQEWVRDTFSISENDSRAVIANYVVDGIALVGVGAAVIYSKAPITLAKKIGFGNRTATKAKVSAEAVAKVEKAIVTETAKVSLLSKIKSYVVGNSPTDLLMRLMLLQQMGDWYFFKNSMVVDLFKSVFGDSIVDKDAWMKSPGPFSAKEYDNYVRAVEAQNPLGIEYPVGSFLYTKETLAKLVSWVYGKALSESRTATPTSVSKEVSTYIIFSNKTTTTTTETPATKETQGSVTVPKIQVFTGVVSQGVLGTGTVFTPRSNDMIDDVNELVQSASINLAGYLAALPSKVVYEIKIVSSITTKDGFTQRGTTTQVKTGTYANGQPKYKTVTNKFAVLYLYILADKGTRTKLAAINIGPVNSVNFQPNSTDLNAVASQLQGVVTTSKVSDIKTVVSDTPVAVTPATPALAPLPNYNTSAKIPNDLGYAFYAKAGDGSNPPSFVVVPDYKFYDPNYGRTSEEVYRRATGDTKDYTNSGYQLVNGVFTQVDKIIPTTTYQTSSPTPATNAPPAQRNGANANTLSEWYTANGHSLPTVQDRSLLYEQYGLGSSALYIGSAEQNMRLLDKLKGL